MLSFGFGPFWSDVGWSGLEYTGALFLILEPWRRFSSSLVFGPRKDREHGSRTLNPGEGRGGVVRIREGNGVHGMYAFAIGHLYLAGQWITMITCY